MSFQNRSQYAQPQQRFVQQQAPQQQMQVKTSSGQTFGVSMGLYKKPVMQVPLYAPKPAPKPQLNVMFTSPGRNAPIAQQTGLMLSPPRNTMQFQQSPSRMQQQVPQQMTQAATSPRRYVALSPNSRAVQQQPQMQQQFQQQNNFRR
jgi:hypothetical protein